MKRSIVIISVIVVTLCSFVFSYFSKPQYGQKKNSAKSKSTYTYVLLGYGGGKHEGTFLTDTILVVHIDTRSKKVVLISVPRDLWVRVPTHSGNLFSSKINSIYQWGLFPKDLRDLRKDFVTNSTKEQPLLAYILNQVTGLDIDGYISINFDTFVKAIDLIGGIDVDIEKSFTDTQYPVEGKENDICGKNEEELKELEQPEKKATASPELQFPCRYETVSFAAGITHLSGSATLRYSRSRHASEDGGDFNRARRQQQVLAAIKSKVLSPYFITRIPVLYTELKNDIGTNLSLTDLQFFIKNITRIKSYPIRSIILSDLNLLKHTASKDGQFILVPKKGMYNYEGIRRLIKSPPTP